MIRSCRLRFCSSRRVYFSLSLLVILALLLGLMPALPAHAVLPAPEGLAPCNIITDPALYPPVGVPTLTWQSVSGAVQYEVEVNSAIGFNGTILAKKTTVYNTFTPTDNTSFANGTYYWRVRAKDSSTWGEYSEICTITQNWNLAPTLQMPADGADIELFTYPTFSWTPVQGAAKYRFDLARDPSFATMVSGYPIQTYVNTFTPVQRLGNATYYWRVTPLDRHGHAGQPSASWSFNLNYARAPQLLAPTNNPTGNPQLIEPRTPTFEWTAVEGADHYELEISTDPGFGTFLTNYGPFSTRATSHTPTRGFTNDTSPVGGYYWRVRAVDRHNNKGPYSQTYRFLLGWSVGDRRPQLLTPVNGSLDTNCPALLTWTPVEGAAYYQIQIAKNDPGMSDPGKRILRGTDTIRNTAYDYTLDQQLPQGACDPAPGTIIYWRVRAIGLSGDKNPPVSGPVGDWSEIFSYANPASQGISPPALIYPYFYYTPPVTNSTYSTVTAPVPVFMWARSMYTQTQGTQYTVQVAANQNFSPVLWQATTQNLSATPTDKHSETGGWLPDPNVTYFWRVSDGRRDDRDPVYHLYWSETWQARFDLRGVRQVTGTVPLLIRPTYKSEEDGKTYGWESVDTFPNLQWTGVVGAARYRVQISRERTFSTVLEEIETDYTNYTPITHYALRDRLFGDYFWRVRALNANSQPLGDWSQTWRFIVSHQPQFKNITIDGQSDFPGASLLAVDDVGDADTGFDLRDLYVTLGVNHVNFGFTALPESSPARYLLVIDTDKADNSGATTDPFGLGMTFNPYHRPEYILSLDYDGNNLVPTMSRLYLWTGNSWSWLPLSSYAGSTAAYDAATGFIELSLLKSALSSAPYSLAMQLISVDPVNNVIKDSVPHDPTPGQVFVVDANAPNTILPFNNSPNETQTLHNMPRYFAWNRLFEDSTYRFRVGRSYDVSSSVDEEGWAPNGTRPFSFHYVPTFNNTVVSYVDNDTYYWHIKMVDPLPNYPSEQYGQTTQFTLRTYVPTHLSPADGAVVHRTPTFSWDPAEWAAAYDIQIANNPGFAGATLVTTEFTNYTPATDLADGNWYWRVRVRKVSSPGVFGVWSATQTFTKSSPVPTGLGTVGGAIINRTPTFVWSPILTPTVNPNLAASAYYLQVSTTPGFNSLYDYATVESTSYTPMGSDDSAVYADGTYYWRVAMVLSSGYGPYSAVMTFTKQYPQVTLVSPRSGSSTGPNPTFIWLPVNGAGRYHIQIAKDPLYNTLVNEARTDNTVYTPLTKLPDGAYYWRVAMLDGRDRRGPWNEAIVLVGNRVYIPLVMRAYRGRLLSEPFFVPVDMAIWKQE